MIIYTLGLSFLMFVSVVVVGFFVMLLAFFIANPVDCINMIKDEIKFQLNKRKLNKGIK